MYSPVGASVRSDLSKDRLVSMVGLSNSTVELVLYEDGATAESAHLL
jgi:hypothetical protein